MSDFCDATKPTLAQKTNAYIVGQLRVVDQIR
jgi:hypothetical protein